MHPLLPINCDGCVCVCVWSRWTSQISLKHSRVFPQVLSSSWRSYLNLSTWAANRPFLWYYFVSATIGMPCASMCLCECLRIYLISDKILTARPRRGSVLLIRALVWKHLWWFQTLMPFVVQKMPLLLSCFPLCSSPPGLRKCGASFTSECLFHFVDRNEMSAGFDCQCCTLWLKIQSVRRVGFFFSFFLLETVRVSAPVMVAGINMQTCQFTRLHTLNHS